jgi:hypothetical protein
LIAKALQGDGPISRQLPRVADVLVELGQVENKIAAIGGLQA